MSDDIHQNILDDVLFDYLLMTAHPSTETETIATEYRVQLEQNGIDVNPYHYTEYTTCYGNFTHFRHNETGKVY